MLLGAATQVWEYPKPRTDFGTLGVILGLIALGYWMASAAWSDMERDLAHGIKPSRLIFVVG
ncbi:hypothetical protein CU102_08390 [Phyllobacterium brassicacearum]|uniref:Uncharacterized protein n=1 Tax=Phyllobacterium brassicacearum TaxID=314235 RepID=A0A2P7BSF4_9HYPH|nr:hypothetical protein CU102_08390 [Phyllobacterium brassicacearum]